MKRLIAITLSVLGFSLSAQATKYTCDMNGHIKVDGHSMNVRLNMEVGFWGYGSVKKNASYSYSIADGRTGQGQLLCTGKDQHGNQSCLPTQDDPVLQQVIITRMLGPVVQVHGQSPIGSMDCKEVSN